MHCLQEPRGSLGSAGGRLGDPVASGQDEQLFGELEPHSVVAVRDGLGDEGVVTRLDGVDCRPEPVCVVAEPCHHIPDVVEPGRELTVQGDEALHDRGVVGRVAVIVR